MGPSSLEFVIVIPAGGGKTTLASNPAFLDIDALYHLEETQSTYDRMNCELRRRADAQEPIPEGAGDELRARLARYDGPSQCLLVHTVSVAKQSGLHLLGVLVPEHAMHEKTVEPRAETGKWFAQTNRSVVLKECEDASIVSRGYCTWQELDTAMDKIQFHNGTLCQRAPLTERSTGMCSQGRTNTSDEEALLHLLTSAVGCSFTPEDGK